MADDKNEGTLQQPDTGAQFNEKTITKMTYREIIEANRESRKGTFMDRSWRDTEENILERPDMTRWEKFKAGGYSVRNVLDRTSK